MRTGLDGLCRLGICKDGYSLCIPQKGRLTLTSKRMVRIVRPGFLAYYDLKGRLSSRTSCTINFEPVSEFPWKLNRNQLNRLRQELLKGKTMNALKETSIPCPANVCCQVFRGCRIGLEFSTRDNKIHWCSSPCGRNSISVGNPG